MTTRDRKIRDHDFPKKERPGCLEKTGLVTTICVLSHPKSMQMTFAARLLASAVIARSIEVLGWQLGAAKSREHDITKKRS